jgi:hypothetical protein
VKRVVAQLLVQLRPRALCPHARLLHLNVQLKARLLHRAKAIELLHDLVQSGALQLLVGRQPRLLQLLLRPFLLWPTFLIGLLGWLFVARARPFGATAIRG